ncbi:MAG: bifunctional 3,4-dihydroxy-2-butanone-4-phosphate synthase/GTP cyclohydrolase II [Ardenticatenia bacterium]|nr:bifunctional 3,4-dihydroxy-2-butanone-4-phosphate synthase/GTP cyclohydrolase II [Ardenticatenia bacterium]
MPFVTVDEALNELRAGHMVIVVDDEDRENEGDLVMAAEKVTPQAINFMTKYGRGLICVALPPERVEALGLPMMVPEQATTAPLGTAFTISVDAKQGTTTGISAHDRATTIRALVDPMTTLDDFVMPGHIFPLRARPGGVLERPGHTEAAVDLTRLAGLRPGGVICEILDDDGSMARRPQLEAFARRHGLRIVTIADLIAYHRRQERAHVRRVAETRLPTRHGEFIVYAYEDERTAPQTPHLALVCGHVRGDEPVLVRIHSECLTGDVFSSLRCDCGSQLDMALHHIAGSGRGVLLYMRQEGRGIGLLHKLQAYALQDRGLDTVEANTCLGFPADMRDYAVCARILADLGISRVRLLTNNPQKIASLQEYGIEVVERIPLVVTPDEENHFYLATKQRKLGHLMGLET